MWKRFSLDFVVVEAQSFEILESAEGRRADVVDVSVRDLEVDE